MKIDIHKAYDSVDWSFIQLILLKVGLSMENIRWIMACITSVSFVVIINGLPTHFFKDGKGLRQGYTLSPLIFILCMDIFSCRIKMANDSGFFAGLSFTSSVCITHSLFFDDLLVFRMIHINY